MIPYRGPDSGTSASKEPDDAHPDCTGAADPQQSDKSPARESYSAHRLTEVVTREPHEEADADEENAQADGDDRFLIWRRLRSL
jgi:hypothetical protein